MNKFFLNVLNCVLVWNWIPHLFVLASIFKFSKYLVQTITTGDVNTWNLTLLRNLFKRRWSKVSKKIFCGNAWWRIILVSLVGYVSLWFLIWAYSYCIICESGGNQRKWSMDEVHHVISPTPPQPLLLLYFVHHISSDPRGLTVTPWPKDWACD